MRRARSSRVDRRIAGNHGAVRQAHDEGRIVLAAIGIDQQAREGRQHRRHAEPPRQAAADRRRARIVGDVALELARRQAEIAVFGRQAVVGMVADDQHAGRRVPVDKLKWRKIIGHRGDRRG